MTSVEKLCSLLGVSAASYYRWQRTGRVKGVYKQLAKALLYQGLIDKIPGFLNQKEE